MASAHGDRTGEGARCGSLRTRDSQVRTPDEDEPNLKMPKTVAAEEAPPALLALPKHILIQIANKLNPVALRNLAFTCKDLLNFCQNTKGIWCTPWIMSSRRPGTTTIRESNVASLCSTKGERYRHSGMDLVDFLDPLRRWPFAVEIECVSYCVQDDSYEEARLKEVFEGVKKFHKLGYRNGAVVPKTARDVEHLAQFIEALHIDKVRFADGVSTDAFSACLLLPLQQLIIFPPFGDVRTLQAIPKSSIPTLEMNGLIPNLPKSVFKDIVKVWQTNEALKKWKFYHKCTHIMSFFDAYEIRSYTYDGPISRSNPPVFTETFFNEDFITITFYLLRQDGKVVRIQHLRRRDPDFDDGAIEFDICPNDEAPPALRNL